MDVPNGGTFKNSSTDATIGSFSGGIWTYTASNLPGIKIEQTGGRPNPRQVKLDGKILVDSTATPPGVPSINSVVKANPEAGFSIVSYTGSGTSNTSVSHGLNAAPELIITKNRDGAYSWRVLTTVIDGSLDRLFLDATNTKADQSGVDVPTSSVFFVGSNLDHNKSGDDIIAYCFAPVAGYSAIGTYEGNGNADGPFVFLGFKPALVILKLTEGVASNWKIYDSTRDSDNPIEKQLYPSLSNAEPSDDARCDFLSNGFKVRTAGSEDNYNNNTFIYAAFAENPFQANGGLAR